MAKGQTVNLRLADSFGKAFEKHGQIETLFKYAIGSYAAFF